MEITLSPKESEEYFYNALCNGTGQLADSGLQLDATSDDDYQKAKAYLKTSNQNACIEDVWMEVLHMGKTLTITDHEGDGEYTRSITLKEVHDRVQKTPIRHLQDMINENDDATTADVILQTVFFEEIIFG